MISSYFKDDNDIGTENNLVVLDPDHPLMERFQRALKNQLLKREQKLTLEAREVKYQLEVNESLILFFKKACFKNKFLTES